MDLASASQETEFLRGDGPSERILVVVPCLNEAFHLEALLAGLLADTEDLDLALVVADGGSTDGSQDIVRRLATSDSRILLLANPARIQSAGVNLAVRHHGTDRDLLIRIDAHAGYPDGYLRGLVETARRVEAASVVVPMATVGFGCFQRAVAAAQNSVLGNGGSAHRTQPVSRWVDHGHHALMRIAAFREVGGYDETFGHNEDAELDTRLRLADHRIWLEASQMIVYYPRSRPWPLLRQYYNYGIGRARNMMKHRTLPRPRQAIPVAVAPAVALALLAPVSWLAVVPACTWMAVCIGYGLRLGWTNGDRCVAMAGPAAMLMHLGWSAGFIVGIVRTLAT